MTLQIIIPIYNEGENVARTCEKLAQEVPGPWHAYFVYDFDADSSLPYLAPLARKDARLRPIKQDLGRGVANALKFGLKIPHEGPVLVMMGDCCDDLSNLGRMLELHAAGAAVVSASRYAEGGRHEGREILKKTLSRLAGWLLHWAGIGTDDPTNSFKMYDGRFLRDVRIESRGGFEVGLELVVKASLQGLPIAQVPTVWKERERGRSNFKLLRWLPYYLRWLAFYLWQRPGKA